jgi:hypothetical protein
VAGEQQQQAAPAPGERPPVSDADKRLAQDWRKRIEAALERHKDQFARFERNRRLLRGLSDPDNVKSPKIRANLYFANLATMRPQVYAKDPEFSITPTDAVPAAKLEAVKRFGRAGEAVLKKVLVKDAKLKKRAKRILTSAYTTSVGWWKCVWQEDKRRDPIIENQLKDTQDNLQRIRQLRAQLDDPQLVGEHDLTEAKLTQTLEGLQAQAEVVYAQGFALDFVLSEDIVILDPSVRELGDYERASAIAHRIWMTGDKYHQTFGYKPGKGTKTFVETAGKIGETSGDAAAPLYCVWEIWEQDSNRIFHVCDGEEGFCDAPSSPDWTGKRWYPFFGFCFNEIDGTFYPLSDVELTEPLVTEYNEARDDLVKDRRDARPFVLVRKGGSLTDKDIKNIVNRQGGDTITVEGIPGKPLSDDVAPVNLGKIDGAVYDTAPARQDIEQIIGGGDAARGSILKAKTATEAEILSQGLRSRSGERQDSMEDLLSELGEYALQVCLRKLSPAEVAKIAGEEAAQSWPVMDTEDVFDLIQVEVKGGSTGKPDRLQEQDRWTKLLPVIEKTIERVSELRTSGQDELAQTLIELTRETLRRFEEKLDIEQYLPEPSEDGQDPGRAIAENAALKAKLQELTAKLDELQTAVDRGYIQAATSIATAAEPMAAAGAFGMALQALDSRPAGGPAGVPANPMPAVAALPEPEIPEEMPALPPEDPTQAPV